MTRLLRPFVLAVVLISALAACSDDDKDPDADPSTTTSASPAPLVTITEGQAAQIKARMSKERVLNLLGEPVLTQDPYGTNTQGCIYYGIAGQPVANDWQFCFNDKGVNLVLTALSPDQPAPPEGASQAHAILLARADSVCQSQDGLLLEITKDVSKALTKYSQDRSAANTAAVVHQIDSFITNLETTHEILAAFNPPEDNAEAYTTYTDTLADQIDALTQAKDAIAEGDLDAYDDHGTDFNDIGQQAITAAQDYGLTTCSAPTWG